jgi:cell volume regulation protein A
MEFNAYGIIACLSLIVVLSYFFGILSKKTSIPSVLMLIVLGVIIHFGLNIIGVSTDKLFSVLEILGIVGLIMIVLEAALELKLKRENIGIISKSFLVGVIGLLVSAFVASKILLVFYPEMGFWKSLLYATPLSILSSAIIIPSVSSLSEEKKEFHVYESTISDILGIMMFYFVLEMVPVPGVFETADLGHVSLGFVGKLFWTLVVSIVASYGLIIGYQKLTSGAKLFLLISILLILYSVGKIFHLSPLLIILIFGLFVSNPSIFFKGKFKKIVEGDGFKDLEHGLHIITQETAFVVRTFFFVLFGITIALSSLASYKVIVASTVLALSIYAIRWVILKVSFGKDITPQLYIAPRGLITVLLFYAIPKDVAVESFDSGILLAIILITSVVMTIGLIKNRNSKKLGEVEENEEITNVDEEVLNSEQDIE